MDGGGQGFWEDTEPAFLLLGKLLALLDILASNVGGDLFAYQSNIVSDENGAEGARGEAPLLAWHAPEVADDLDPVPRLGQVNQIIVSNYVHRPGQLPRGSLLGHLLHRESLVILELGQTKLSLKRITIFILSGVGSSAGIGIERCQVRVHSLHGLPGGRAEVDRLYNLGPHQGALGDDALQAHEVPKIPGSEGARCNMLGSKASLKSNKEVLSFFSIGCIDGTNELLESSLKRSHLLERLLQQGECPLPVLGTQVIDRDHQPAPLVLYHVSHQPVINPISIRIV